MSTPEKVSFLSRNCKIAALFHPPAPGAPNRAGAVVVIDHPWTSIKEQSPANYARELSKAGFACLTYDAAYQGESEGEPRNLEDPYQGVEDIKSAVTYLHSLKGVDANKIGALGICAAGGYVPFAAQTDLRASRLWPPWPQGQLEAAGNDRNSDVTGKKVPIVHLLPETFEDAGSLPESFRDLISYYRTPRGNHPCATNTIVPRS